MFSKRTAGASCFAGDLSVPSHANICVCMCKYRAGCSPLQGLRDNRERMESHTPYTCLESPALIFVRIMEGETLEQQLSFQIVLGFHSCSEEIETNVC